MDKYTNIKTIFFCEALVTTLSQNTRPYKQELKYTINNLKRLYNKEITKDMIKMYENHEEAFEKISDYTEKIGIEFSKINPQDYGNLLNVLKKFNSGELFKKSET